MLNENYREGHSESKFREEANFTRVLFENQSQNFEVFDFEKKRIF